MKLDITQYTIEELIEIKNNIDNHIYNYKDGFIYICKFRSYGKFWIEHVNNTFELNDLCHTYDGENGIMDIYSNNPDLSNVYNYGKKMYITSKDDFNKWEDYELLKNLISTTEDELKEWDNRENVSFYERPLFAPFYSIEDLNGFKQKIAEYDMSFVPPVNYQTI